MQPLQWTTDDFVFIAQMDADHQKLFRDTERVRQAVASGTPAGKIGYYLWRLSKGAAAHFASEERLMRSSRYPALEWHERQHQAGAHKLARLTEAVHGKDGHHTRDAIQEFADWMKDHIRLADRMFAAHLRNDQRERLAS